MPRPDLPPHLVARQPRTVLAWSMKKLRLNNHWTAKQLADAYGCSPAHISRVEQGQTRPSRMLLLFYEEVFEAEGLLASQLEVVEQSDEQERRRWRGKRPRLYQATADDASTFVGDTIPHGTLMTPGQVFEKSWRVRNSGTVPWVGRRLERQGPLTGPGLITSTRFIDMPDTQPGDIAEMHISLQAPTYDCASIAYFRQVDSHGKLCFPDNYPLGLDVLVLVRGQVPDEPSLIDTGEWFTAQR
jgi:transcriptional regulator with XRE-family HTH domain